MASISQTDYERVQRLVGSIGLECQDAARTLKAILPFLNNNDDPSLSAALKKHERLKKKTLGELAGMFVDSTTSESLDFAKHMAYLVATRNQVVHHFNETYGQKLTSGATQEVFDSLETLLANLRILRTTTEQIALAIFEGLRDFTFKDTPQHHQMADLCARLRERFAS